jgi:hypothetical protein
MQPGWFSIRSRIQLTAMTSHIIPSPRLLDVRAILDSSLRLFAVWLIGVLVVTFAGYPGVVCVTPMAWLLALSVGLRCASTSASLTPGKRILEAALAGALLGLLQGILFSLIVGRMGEIAPDEQVSALGLSAGMLCAGILAAAALAAFNAWLLENRRRAAQRI